MTSIAPARSPWVLICLIAAYGAAIAWLIGAQFSELDREMYRILAPALGGPLAQVGRAEAPSAISPVAESILLLIFSLAATFTGFRLPRIPRLLAFYQLLLLSLLVQWVIWRFAEQVTHPLGHLAAILEGCLAGYILRQSYLSQRKAHSQYCELLLRNRELQETKLQLVKQDEIERRTLAGDLHDQVLNDLKAIGHQFESYRASPDDQAAQAIGTLLKQSMVEIREVMESLFPSALENLGLVAAIRECLKRASERAGFKAHVESELSRKDLKILSMVEQSLLYRLVQESVTNIVKHARATTVRTSLSIHDQELFIRVSDNGRGFDQTCTGSNSRGMRYMRQRADLIGATIAWIPGEGNQGTTVEIRLALSGRGNEQSSGS